MLHMIKPEFEDFRINMLLMIEDSLAQRKFWKVSVKSRFLWLSG